MIQGGIRYEVGISGTYGLARKIQVYDLHQHSTTCAKYGPQELEEERSSAVRTQGSTREGQRASSRRLITFVGGEESEGVSKTELSNGNIKGATYCKFRFSNSQFKKING